MPNRLAAETSPYLLQHQNNPVDWYPWGPEALDRARREDRPILLSIGYAACHWCHVMERESFEDAGTAAVMNDLFVNIKVDREERPDLDSIYMQAVQAMTGHGGWPMTMFLTPAMEPFYGGTYFPPQDRHGLPSFTRVMRSVAEAYRTQRDNVATTAATMRQLYDDQSRALRSTGSLTASVLDRAYRTIAARYDVQNGGLDGAPKFPQTMALDFLLRYGARTNTPWAREMALTSFRKMARGGIYDQVGGGFARYSTDAEWLVPHFEKMLYDNALLVRLGAHLWQATADDEVRQVVEETVRWVEREMTSGDGGFYSSLDADSEGHEGLFYLWDESEIDELLGPDAAAVKQHYGVTSGGNFEGRNLLHVAGDPRATASRLGVQAADLDEVLSRAKEVLYAARSTRVWPALDDKVISGWNGLMLRALSEAARAFQRDDWTALAVRNGEFLMRELVRDGGRVMRSHRNGVTKIPGVLEDHASVALAFHSLYSLTFDRRWLDGARAIAAATVEWFWDTEAAAFFDTASDAEPLITRPREATDNAVPAGNSLAVELLIVQAELFDDDVARSRASQVLESLAEPMARYAPAFGHLLGAADMVVHGAVELAIVGSPDSAEFRELVAEAARHYFPALVIAGGKADAASGIPLLEQRDAVAGHATAYVCRLRACDAPAISPGDLRAGLERAARAAAATIG